MTACEILLRLLPQGGQYGGGVALKLRRAMAASGARTRNRRYRLAKGTLFFTAFEGVHGRELWRSDGTEAGTVLVDDIRPGGLGSDPGDFDHDLDVGLTDVKAPLSSAPMTASAGASCGKPTRRSWTPTATARIR